MTEIHNYGDCYFCGGEVVEKVIEVEFRWKGKLYIVEGVPKGLVDNVEKSILLQKYLRR